MYINTNKLNILILFIVIGFSFTWASEGDRSPFYQKCTNRCIKVNCTDDEVSFTEEASKNLEYFSWLLRWNCRDECRYHCMWRTVQGFHERGYQTPKFHGKWPFERILGVQEPASVFASLLNLLVHIQMYVEINRQLAVRTSGMLYFWKLFTVIGINTWICSIIFHTRDNEFTEFLDYASALLMVINIFVAALVRIFSNMKTLIVPIILATVAIYVDHVIYLFLGKVDYSYNMKLNLIFGVSGSGLWLCWALRRRARRLALCQLLAGAALALELLDFPPRRHWDAHALWHLATAPLALLFYRFVKEDLRYTQETRDSETAELKLD